MIYNGEIILVFYVYVGSALLDDYKEIIKKSTQNIEQPEGMLFFYVPTLKPVYPSIECINPKLVGYDEYNQISKKIDELIMKYKDLQTIK
jgi:F0F1-type ATP synthase beta subunit